MIFFLIFVLFFFLKLDVYIKKKEEIDYGFFNLFFYFSIIKFSSSLFNNFFNKKIEEKKSLDQMISITLIRDFKQPWFVYR